MNYDLAKQLKDAGFPGEIQLPTNPSGSCKYPTLSELIEACGEEFGSLSKGNNGIWYAAQWAMKEEVRCPSPEEAVAVLWLALKENEKSYCGGPIKTLNVVHTMDRHLNQK